MKRENIFFSFCEQMKSSARQLKPKAVFDKCATVANHKTRSVQTFLETFCEDYCVAEIRESSHLNGIHFVDSRSEVVGISAEGDLK